MQGFSYSQIKFTLLESWHGLRIRMTCSFRSWLILSPQWVASLGQCVSTWASLAFSIHQVWWSVMSTFSQLTVYLRLWLGDLTAFRREKHLTKDPYSLDFFFFSNHLTLRARNSNKRKLKKALIILDRWCFANLFALFS